MVFCPVLLPFGTCFLLSFILHLVPLTRDGNNSFLCRSRTDLEAPWRTTMGDWALKIAEEEGQESLGNRGREKRGFLY